MTSTYVITRRLYTQPWQEQAINKTYNIANRIYNTGVRHYAPIIHEIKHSKTYRKAIHAYRTTQADTPEHEQASKTLTNLIKQYKLNEYDIHAYLDHNKTHAYDKGIGINIVQKLATNLHQAIIKVIYGTGKHLHYRKHGQTNTVEDKTANSGIIYKISPDLKEYIYYRGMKLPIKPIRHNDEYLKQAMRTCTIKYCRLVRQPFRNGYKYFVQLIVSGEIPLKITPGQGTVGIDPGMTTMAYDGENGSGFIALSANIVKVKKDIKRAQRKYTRRLIANNPDNYLPDGQVKRGVKLTWYRSRGVVRALFELKDAYRRKSEILKCARGRDSNLLVGAYDSVVVEKMNYKSYQKRARAKKDPVTGVICRRRRFGRSIGSCAPAAWVKAVHDKVLRYGGDFLEVPVQAFALSQLEHSGVRVKHELSKRSKMVGGVRVQRDLYSAFLCSFVSVGDDGEFVIDLDSACAGFDSFLERQGRVVERVRASGDVTGNFGLCDFV